MLLSHVLFYRGALPILFIQLFLVDADLRSCSHSPPKIKLTVCLYTVNITIPPPAVGFSRTCRYKPSSTAVKLTSLHPPFFEICDRANIDRYLLSTSQIIEALSVIWYVIWSFSFSVIGLLLTKLAIILACLRLMCG